MLLTNVRHALRLIRLNPGSSAAIVLTLTLAIAANSTLFTLIDAALLVPLPVRDPASLVNVYTSQADGSGFGALSYPDFADLVSSSSAFEDALGYSGLMVTATGSAGSEVLFGELVTANYFSMLGVRPAIGRGFEDREGRERGAHPVAVIGDRLWRRRYGGDPAVIGQTLTLNGRPYTIVGVAPREFPGLLFRAMSADVWLPVAMMGQVRTDQLDNRDERWMFVKARLRPGRTAEHAAAAAAVVAARLDAAYPASNKGRRFRIVPTADVLVHPEGDKAVVSVAAAAMLAAALVLLVACANLAGVMLARGLSRRREIAIRLAIGARPSQIAGQLMVESVVLSALGGAGGLLVARWFAAALAAWRPELPVPMALNTAMDWRVAAFTFAASVLAVVLFALFPALRAARTPAAGSLARGSTRRRRLLGARDLLLIPQVAIALALVAVAGLFTRSLASVDGAAPGFDIDRTAFVSLNLAMSGYDDARASQFYDRLSERLTRRGVATRAALTDRLPLDIYGNQTATVDDGSGAEARSIQVGHVAAGYFETIGIPIVVGRAFDAADQAGTFPIAIVSDAAARRFWPGASPIGRQLRIGDGAPAVVVGVAADAKVRTLGEPPEPFVYLPMRGGAARLVRLVVQTSRDPGAAAAELRREVALLDPAVAVFEARSMADNLSVMLYPYRLAAGVGAALGLLALVLSGIGLYGLLACGVAESLRDLAIRSALGAGALTIVRTATAEATRATLIGLGAGSALALIAARLLRGVIFGISPVDPLALGGAAAVLALVIALATIGPVRRAIRVAPMSVLRQG